MTGSQEIEGGHLADGIDGSVEGERDILVLQPDSARETSVAILSVQGDIFVGITAIVDGGHQSLGRDGRIGVSGMAGRPA